MLTLWDGRAIITKLTAVACLRFVKKRKKLLTDYRDSDKIKKLSPEMKNTEPA